MTACLIVLRFSGGNLYAAGCSLYASTKFWGIVSATACRHVRLDGAFIDNNNN